MVSLFLREQKRYTLEDLIKSLHCSEDKAILILKRLKEYGILKVVKRTDPQMDLSDLSDEDVEVIDLDVSCDEYLYIFSFVGVVTIDGRVLKCYPKYLLNTSEPKDELKQILKVLDKYNAKEQIIRMYSESNDGGNFNLLAVMLYLLNDYHEYGSYTNTQDIVETNGFGEVLWEKTINETFTLISNKRPYYPELLTKKRINDDFDFFKRLHECIVTKCSKELGDADLLDLFDILGVNLSDEEVDDFGDVDYILERIQKELNVQFNTRKQLLLKSIYSYIAKSSSLNDLDCMSMYGTNSFNLVWEEVCAEVMDNQLKQPLGALKLPVPLCGDYHKNDSLLSLIEKPVWYGYGSDGKSFSKTASDTLIPDLISIINANGEYQFIIFDAKYYNLQLEENKALKGQPGIESITKQYLYQLAYKKFIKDHGIHKVANCFLLPTDKSTIIPKGYVALEMLHSLGLENIQIRLLPASMMYSLYIQNKKIDIFLLDL